ncbi:hypothetical protein Tfer_2724 [Thermincola ferriacetica]|uniref:Uncharacterized protein n=1 Tax=Thermincola ferriacetica TaxID=281456 RepID=A0A0L6W0X1_9FIRM|nr:hypothetical protein Tfer_2724 [Thermincola ferriacetica]
MMLLLYLEKAELTVVWRGYFHPDKTEFKIALVNKRKT